MSPYSIGRPVEKYKVSRLLKLTFTTQTPVKPCFDEPVKTGKMENIKIGIGN